MPNILAVAPANLETDVILGASVVVTFDSIMDPTTITNATFSLTGPAQTQILTPQQLISNDPNFITGRNTISGTFSSTVNSSSQTVLTFTPNTSLLPNSQYTVLLIGSGALLVGSTIKDIDGNPLSANYQWTFKTGELNTRLPPIQAPLPYEFAAIDPKCIRVKVNGKAAGNLLDQSLGNSYTVSLIFPAPIDQSSFDPSDILLALEPFLCDPTIPIPTGLIPSITVADNIITITLSN